MGWEIKLYWDCCPYLKNKNGDLRCENFDNMTYICNENQCPKKLEEYKE